MKRSWQGATVLEHKVYPYSTGPIPLYSEYSKLQNVKKVVLDSRLGPTLFCLDQTLVREKKSNSEISYFYATTTKPSDQVKMEGGEVKEARWRKGRWRRER